MWQAGEGDGLIMKEEEKREKKENGEEEEKVYHRHCLTCCYCTNTIEGKFCSVWPMCK